MRRLRLLVPVAALTVAAACTPVPDILSPLNGSTQSGSTTQVVIDVPEGATPEAQIDGVGINLSQSDITTYEATIEGVLTNGQHTIDAQATNAEGTGTDQATFNVDNSLVPGSVLVLGDSINEQAFDPLALEQTDANGNRVWFPNDNTPSGDLRYAIYRGWSTATPEIIQAVADEVAAMRPEVLVLPFGTNEASVLFAPGWTQADIDSYNYLLNNIHDDTWVVFIIPGHGVVAADQPAWVHDWAASIELARPDILAIANARPNSVVIDWQVFIDAHPELISPDGIHLRPEDGSTAELGQLPPTVTDAANLRQDVQWDGVRQARELMTP